MFTMWSVKKKQWVKWVVGVCVCLCFASCSTPQQISYFQDLKPGESVMEVAYPASIRIQPGDQLSIIVKSRDPQLSELFNLPIQSSQIGSASRGNNGVKGSSNSSRGLSGYTVDQQGEIDFPGMGINNYF